MELITDLEQMRNWAEQRRAAGARIGLVPTMGALHEGHMALVRKALGLADLVVVSIFVNPIQFNNASDFENYPRDLEQDSVPLAEAGVDVLFVPEAAAMYPPGFETHVEVERATAPLCGAHRPGHFRGVTTVVAKLFHLTQPHVAVFGEKDYQQLVAIRRMVADLGFGIEVVGVPTVRERDGLALSSRNRRLTPAERAAARCVPRALRAAMDLAASGERAREGLIEAVSREIRAESRARLEYVDLRHPETLEEMAMLNGEACLALAVWIGDVRLIDNCLITSRLATPASGNGRRASESGAGQPTLAAGERT
jgi:pantoate--beta-alanine ligase